MPYLKPLSVAGLSCPISQNNARMLHELSGNTCSTAVWTSSQKAGGNVSEQNPPMP